MLESLRSLRKPPIHKHLRFGYSSRDECQVRMKNIVFFFAAFASLAGEISPILLVAAAPRWISERSTVVKLGLFFAQ